MEEVGYMTTRDAVNLAIALRLGWRWVGLQTFWGSHSNYTRVLDPPEARPREGDLSPTEDMPLNPFWDDRLPDFFEDEAAARKVVLAMAGQSDRFVLNLRILMGVELLRGVTEYDLLLATPRQKVEAACQIWGIDLKGWRD
jgi:hypothetical protein